MQIQNQAKIFSTKIQLCFSIERRLSKWFKSIESYLPITMFSMWFQLWQQFIWMFDSIWCQFDWKTIRWLKKWHLLCSKYADSIRFICMRHKKIRSICLNGLQVCEPLRCEQMEMAKVVRPKSIVALVGCERPLMLFGMRRHFHVLVGNQIISYAMKMNVFHIFRRIEIILNAQWKGVPRGRLKSCSIFNE